MNENSNKPETIYEAGGRDADINLEFAKLAYADLVQVISGTKAVEWNIVRWSIALNIGILTLSLSNTIKFQHWAAPYLPIIHPLFFAVW